MKNKGFTLLELLVVIVIIGALVGIGAPNFMKQLSKPRDAERATAVESMESMVKISAANSFDIAVYEFKLSTLNVDNINEKLICEVFADNDYIVPQPKKGLCYYYAVNSDGAEFAVFTELEEKSKSTNKAYHIAGTTAGVNQIEGVLGNAGYTAKTWDCNATGNTIGADSYNVYKIDETTTCP